MKTQIRFCLTKEELEELLKQDSLAYELSKDISNDVEIVIAKEWLKIEYSNTARFS